MYSLLLCKNLEVIFLVLSLRQFYENSKNLTTSFYIFVFLLVDMMLYENSSTEYLKIILINDMKRDIPELEPFSEEIV